jgi:hypothetical protein
MTSRLRVAFFVATLAMAPAARAQTAADLETARALFKEGRELRAKGDLRGALEKLRAAHAAGRTPVTGIELARTHVMLGQLVEAREVALDAGRIRVAADETERSVEARADAARLADELRERIPDVTVHVSGVPGDVVPDVSLDGKALPAALLGQPFKVDPGEHVVVVVAPGGATSRATVAVGERESRAVAVAYPAVGVAPPPGPPAPATSEPDGFFFGVSFAIVPQVYLPQEAYAATRKSVTEVTIGAGVEVGAALTPGFEVFVRGLATAGPRGTPISDLFGIGPAMAFRAGRRWWFGATLLGGRGEANFGGVAYSTDWVFAPTIDVSFAAIERTHGQWLVSASLGYVFADEQKFAPLVFAPLTFGYRSF